MVVLSALCDSKCLTSFVSAILQPVPLDADDVRDPVSTETASQRNVVMPTSLEKASKRTPLGRFVMKIGEQAQLP